MSVRFKVFHFAQPYIMHCRGKYIFFNFGLDSE